MTIVLLGQDALLDHAGEPHRALQFCHRFPACLLPVCFGQPLSPRPCCFQSRDGPRLKRPRIPPLYLLLLLPNRGMYTHHKTECRARTARSFPEPR